MHLDKRCRTSSWHSFLIILTLILTGSEIKSNLQEEYIGMKITVIIVFHTGITIIFVVIIVNILARYKENSVSNLVSGFGCKNKKSTYSKDKYSSSY